MSDFDRLMKRAAEEPWIEPDIQRAWDRGRTLRIRRTLATGVAVMSVAGLGGAVVESRLNEGDDLRRAAKGVVQTADQPAPGPGYVLDQFVIEYPYKDESQGSAELAGVGYVAHWATGSYPGVASCRVTLFDARGKPVGQSQFELDSGTEEFIRPVGEVVVVSERPVSADGVCSEGNQSGRNYSEVEATDIAPSLDESDPTEPVPYEDRLSITFDVDWPEGTAPFLKTCRIAVVYKDGSERVDKPFNSNLVSGRETYNVFVGSPADVETAYLRCEDFVVDQQ